MITFTLDHPQHTALRSVRGALAQHGLRVSAELDVASSIREEIGASVAPCVVLYVDDPLMLLEAVVFHRGAALLVPCPVVVSGNGRHTEVTLRSLTATAEGGLPVSVREPLEQIHARIVHALETVAQRETAELLLSQ